MAAEEVKPNPELDALFAELAEPFDPSEIKWRVTHTTQDSSRGAVIPFADPRPYTDRLNQIFTPMGWTRSYDVNTVSAVSRMKRDKLIPTGKVLVTCALTIHRLGCHTGGGEEWADEQSAMTRAEAQAFKRACICFGLGRYLYNFAEMWVPVNEHRQPLQIPSLPRWALPSATGTAGKSNPASGPKPPMGPHRSEDNVEDRRVSAHPRLPDIRRNPLAHRACTKSECNTERAAPNRRGRRDERATRGIHKANSLAEEIGDTPFIAVLDRLQIRSITTIRNLGALRQLVAELEKLAGRQAA